MNRFSLAAASGTVFVAALLPLPASAQAFRCPDAATGKITYTDQPCKNGELVAPRRTEEERRQDEGAAQAAREREALRQEQAMLREQQRLEAARIDAITRATQAPHSAESADCRAARAEADFRARSFSATEEQIRTARYNAALACGQQPPNEIVVVQPQVLPRYPRPHYPDTWPGVRPPRPPSPGFGMPTGQPTPALPGRTQIDPMRQHIAPLPVNPRPPRASHRTLREASAE